ncbi:MAG: hypothetical protein GX096_03790 [Clostridiales bacterium]|nr:hypothetical protein [Clostridiales bacterium]
MAKNRRILAMLIAVAVFVVMMFSTTYIACHGDHDCHGEDCPICHVIDFCSKTLKSFCFAAISAAIGIAYTYIARVRLVGQLQRAVKTSLVTLKVKLSN